MKRKVYGIGYREFLLWVFPGTEEDLLPIRKQDENFIINILNRLKGEQGEVVKMRFALGGEKFNTLKQVSERINKHKEWARQLELKALRELRQPWQKKHFGIFFRTFAEEKLLETGTNSSLLETSMDEFDLSVRTRNCLKNADIKTIGDLIKKTEQEMLRTKNFGRKSLNELKKVLSEKGLGFRGQEGS